MGFRLSSAIAGFATRTSENLDELQTKADDIAKTAAARYANEALQVRKERMKSRQDYLEAATFLKNNYGLSNNQVEVVLSGGIANKDLFVERMKDVEDAAYTSAKANGEDMSKYKFDKVAGLGQIFSGEESGDGRAIIEQAKLFASRKSPFASPDMQSLGDSISKSTKTIFGAIGPEYGMQQFEAQLKAQAGEMPEEYDITTGFGDTGLTATLTGLSQEEKRKIQQFDAQIKTTNLTNEQLEKNNAWIDTMKIAELENLNLSNDLLGVKIDNADLENIKLGFETSMLNDKLTDWRDWGKDLNKKQKEAELANIIAQTINSGETSPTNVLGGLLKERSRIESGKLDGQFKTKEEKAAAIEQLSIEITRTQAVISTLYEAQRDTSPDITGMTTMSAYAEEFKEQQYDKIGISDVTGISIYTDKEGTKHGENSPAYIEAKAQADKLAHDKFKRVFLPGGKALNAAAETISNTFDSVGQKNIDDKNTIEEFSSMPIEDVLTGLVNNEKFNNTREGKADLILKIKGMYKDKVDAGEMEMPQDADLIKMLNDAIANKGKPNAEKQALMELIGGDDTAESTVELDINTLDLGEISLSSNIRGYLTGQTKLIENYKNAKTIEEKNSVKEDIKKLLMKPKAAGGYALSEEKALKLIPFVTDYQPKSN